MKVLLFGATGMIGQGVLRECLLDPGVERVLAVGRSASGQGQEKLRDLVTADLMNLSPHAATLSGYDACFFCLGVSALGMSEEAYTRVTLDLTVAVASTLIEFTPNLIFIYVSGQGTDSTERGRAMWARVKGRTENAMLQLSAKTYMMRPGFILPMHGIRSRTPMYNAFYVVATPLYPLLRRVMPGAVTTTEKLGRAMIAVARGRSSKRVLETSDINSLSM